MKISIATTMLLASLFAGSSSLAQLPYTEKNYAVQLEKDIAYGTTTGFAGQQVELLLDLYKPVGDGNCKRPLLVMVHGGGFIAGTRNDADVVQICQEMAARGYVTASIEYRLGAHPLAYYEPYALCNDAINPVGISKCIYLADTMEFYRGALRAVQDTRGAIRFLKGRHDLDSTDVENVFVGGSSAGAITALHVGLLDQPSEQLPHTGPLADAPLPDGDLASCVPSPGTRSRPDLGTAEGNLHLNGYDSRVQGIANFMGAVFNLSILGGNTPPLYLYHRTDDLVVPSNTSQLFGLYPHCLNPINLCQPLYTRPWASGSATIRDALANSGSTAFFDDVLDSYGPADGDDCFDNPSGHSIENIPLRCQNLSGFFADIIAASGNSPSANCASATFGKLRNDAQLRIMPNPVSHGQLNVRCEPCPPGSTEFRLLDLTGRQLASCHSTTGSASWQLGHLPTGVYLVQARTAGGVLTKRVAVQ